MNSDVKNRLAELKEKGFTSSTSDLHSHFARHPEDLEGKEKVWFKLYSEVDLQLFGKRDLIFYIDPERKNEFATRLEEFFRFKNPAPSTRLASAFTYFMHNFAMHWSGCGHLRKAEKQRICLNCRSVQHATYLCPFKAGRGGIYRSNKIPKMTRKIAVVRELKTPKNNPDS